MEAFEELRQRVSSRRLSRREIPPERLMELTKDLPVADQAAFAASARAAIASHPSSQQAWEQFSDAGAKQYAGRPLNPAQREAVETVLAASPATVWETFGGGHSGDIPPAQVEAGRRNPARYYDPRLMDQHAGLEAFRREAQHRPAEGGPDDLPF